MSYHIHPDGTRTWVRTRPTRDHNDTLRVSAEVLAEHVEDFLYDTDHPHFRDADYLAWAVALFDTTKSGYGMTGGPYQAYDPDKFHTHPLPPTKQRRSHAPYVDTETRAPHVLPEDLLGTSKTNVKFNDEPSKFNDEPSVFGSFIKDDGGDE